MIDKLQSARDGGDCIEFIPKSGSEDINVSVLQGTADYGIVSAEALAQWAPRIGFKQAELNPVLEAQIGFAYSTATELAATVQANVQ